MKNFKGTSILLLALLLSVGNVSNLFAQGYIQVTGRVLDNNTAKPLHYASISLLNSTVSNVTNADGIFVVKIPTAKFNALDSVQVSYLGYSTVRICVSDFPQGKVKTIRMVESFVRLSSIYIYPNDPLSLFNLVFSPLNIKKNYPNEPCGMLGFYRELVKKGNKYASMNEAVLDIRKASYTNSFASDNAAIYKGRGNENSNVNDTIIMRLQGGPLSAMYTDIMKYPFIGTDALSAPDYYDFSFDNPIVENNHKIYVLKFNQKDSVVKECLYKGKLYIDSETFALIKATFSMNVDVIQDAWKYFIRKKPVDATLKVEDATYEVNYKMVGQKYMFDYSRMELRFSAKYKHHWMKNKYLIVGELAVTDTDNPAGLKLDPDRKIHMKDILSKRVNDFSDPEFWGNYNIIQPDENIQSIINKIIRQLKRHED
ncbi:MAG TPA: carboxypeptidase-like regulatory domain-containing protein [Candidatus Egerieousia sp.]|nr:carboxypeptidase-like regulatory domain-containing protein [Candidatus Egerieousia sp.]HPT06449.1 carboxypeptidase-like regulatory domain-containing protein [Candidatus Egerieousia sp.]